MLIKIFSDNDIFYFIFILCYRQYMPQLLYMLLLNAVGWIKKIDNISGFTLNTILYIN